MSDLTYQSASAMARLVRERQISPTALLRAHLDRIERVNPKLNAIVNFDPSFSQQQAERAEKALTAGENLGPLHGVPITIKSSIDVKGLICECGSRLRQGHVAERDATLVARLKKAGAVIIGNTNVPDLLAAYETDNLLYGRTNSPWNLDYTPGGSSGGEAAAIASGCSAAGIGSDGGGSVRVPAHFSGICGLKPTPGLIPRTGHWPACIGPSAFLGLVGPMARHAEDLRLLLEVTSGGERHDPSCAPVTLRAPSPDELSKVRIGWFGDNGLAPVTPETTQAVGHAAAALSGTGLAVEPVEIEGLESAQRLWRMLFSVAGAALLKPLTEGREGELHPLVRHLMASPEEAEAAGFDDLLNAWVNRDRLRSKLLGQMERYPILLCPVSSVPAFRHGERQWRIEGREISYPEVFTHSQIFNLLSNPAAVVPVGRSPEGLPIGVQIVGRHFEDELVVAVAERLQQALGGWRPPPDQFEG